MKKIILFGDSITAGYKNGEIDTILNDKINEKLPDTLIQNAGIPGDTTRGALDRVERHVVAYCPDVVTVFFGANDAWLYSGITEHEFQENLETLVRSLSDSRVILLGVPYANQSVHEGERSEERLRRFNDVSKAVAEKYQVPFIDVLTEMLVDDNQVSYLQEDGLHFSEEGYQLLARLIIEEIQ